MLYRQTDDGNELFINSYMDDTGVDERKLTGPPPVFYDELLLELRARLGTLAVGQSFEVASSFLTSRPAWSVATAEIVEIAPTLVKTDNDEAHDGTRVVLGLRGPAPRPSCSATTSWPGCCSGRTTAATTTACASPCFMDYWNRNKPGDEDLLR